MAAAVSHRKDVVCRGWSASTNRGGGACVRSPPDGTECKFIPGDRSRRNRMFGSGVSESAVVRRKYAPLFRVRHWIVSGFCLPLWTECGGCRRIDHSR